MQHNKSREQTKKTVCYSVVPIDGVQTLTQHWQQCGISFAGFLSLINGGAFSGYFYSCLFGFVEEPEEPLSEAVIRFLSQCLSVIMNERTLDTRYKQPPDISNFCMKFKLQAAILQTKNGTNWLHIVGEVLFFFLQLSRYIYTLFIICMHSSVTIGSWLTC